MVAILAGAGALLFGLALLLLPLLVTELSRPGDAAWGALVLVLALVLVTSADRLTGAPMLAVISGGLLVGRLTAEVGGGRWRQLSPEERQRLGTRERWRASVHQTSTALLGLLAAARERGGALLAQWRQRRPAKTSGKRWVRPEAEAESSLPAAAEVREVSDFTEVDALLRAAPLAVAPVEAAAVDEGPKEATSGQATPEGGQPEAATGGAG